MNKMLFSKIFVEEEVRELAYTKKILEKLPGIPNWSIDRYDRYFQKFKKPYLEKRENLNLYIAKNRGKLIKEAPPAYGEQKGKHYYFVHAFNCIYECQYCYLQGYFKSPDIVLFTNHDEICAQIETMVRQSSDPLTFHAGEFSDSLALNSITNEWADYFDCFRKLPEARLELRTKSTQISNLLKLKAPSNVVVSFSLSTQEDSIEYDLKTPSSLARLRALHKLQKAGYKIALHFDPIIFEEKFFDRFKAIVKALPEYLDILNIEYISLGVVRFSKEVFKEVQQNYPDSKMIHLGEFVSSQDQKIKYPSFTRNKILNRCKEELVSLGVPPEKVYLCMEND